MACNALAVDKVAGGKKLLVRIVAGDAAQTSIPAIKALAVGQTVRLKAHIQRPAHRHAHHGFPGAVALPAKLRNFIGAALLKAFGQEVCLSFQRGRLMK